MSVSMLNITYGYLKKFLKDPISYGAYFTGSRAFGVEIEDSDYDYVITTNNWYKIHQEIERIYFDTDYEGGLFKSVHFNYDGNVYNILVMNDTEFKCWRWATKMMIILTGKNNAAKKIICNKGERVKLFEMFKELYRNHIDIPF